MEVLTGQGVHSWDKAQCQRDAAHSFEDLKWREDVANFRDEEDDNDDEDEEQNVWEYPVDPMRSGQVQDDSTLKGTPDGWISRNPSLVRLTGKHPFNAEPPLQTFMAQGFLTPSSLHYVRNHGAVPKATWEGWEIEICGLVRRPAKLKMDNLVKAFTPREVPVTLVCAGNRRKEQNMVKQTIGFNWGPSAISTSVWRGVRLCDVLRWCGVLPKRRGALHVCFDGADNLPGGGGSNYGTSISIDVAMDPANDALLAYMQNGELLHPDHGFPLRVIVPGCIGGRMVKWVKRIRVCDQEATGFYHYHDNRLLPSHVDAEKATSQGWWFKAPYIIYELNINSVITTPAHGQILPINSESLRNPYAVKGYAYSGGGRKVMRVEVTTDGGETWNECIVNHPEKATRNGRHWCWCFWEVYLDTAALLEAKEIAVRAWDSSMNTQPKDLSWNVLGMMNNCWFRIQMSLCMPRKGELGIECQHPTQPGNESGGWMTKQIAEPVLTKSSSTPSMKVNNAPPSISMAQVRQHQTKDSAWIVISGHVYDCTRFLESHPGGADSIMINAGTDCTEEFEAIHSSKAKSMLQEYLIGELVAAPETPESLLPAIDEAEQLVALNPRRKIQCKLVGKTVVSHDTRIFRFSLPNPHMPLGLPVGKHLFLSANVSGKLCIRAYTPVSTGEGFFELLVKIYSDGMMTQFLESGLSVGDTMDVKGPIGHIEYEGKGMLAVGGKQRHVKKMAMVAGGTGITPMYQLIEAVLADPLDDTEIFLVYANRSEQDILLRRELEIKVAIHGNRFHVWYVVSQPAEGKEWTYSVGRVNIDILSTHLPPGCDGTVAFLCGPPAMIEYACIPNLEKLNYCKDSCLIF